MPSSEPTPRNLHTWLQLLEPLQPPVDAEVRAAALAALAEGASASKLTQLLLRDPAQVLILFREANRALARYDREAHTLEHAISLLGAGRMQTLLEQAVTLRTDHPHANRYRQALLRSRHAAWQARLCAEGTGRWPADELFWSTLLAAAPLWLLWLEAGTELLALEDLRARQGAVSAQTTLQLLGCAPRELGAEFAQRWQLPQMSQHAWQEKAAGTVRQWVGLQHAARLEEPPAVPDGELNELSHNAALMVALANVLADEADWDWQSRRCLRLLHITASACRRPLATIIAYCHQTAAAISRDSIPSDLLTPGAKLLGEWRQAYCWPNAKRPVAAAVLAPTPSAATAAISGAPAAVVAVTNEKARLFASTLQQLREPTSINGSRAALELALQAAHRALDLKRVAVLLVRPGNHEVQTVLSAGAEKALALRQFRFAAKNNQLFSQMLGKPICLRISAENRAKFWPHLPDPFRTAVGCDQFLLMSLFAGERPVALLYADNGPGAKGPSDQQHLLFKQLCQQVSACLGQMS